MKVDHQREGGDIYGAVSTETCRFIKSALLHLHELTRGSLPYDYRVIDAPTRHILPVLTDGQASHPITVPAER